MNSLIKIGKRLDNIVDHISKNHPQDKWVLSNIIPMFLEVISSSTSVQEEQLIISKLNKLIDAYGFRYNQIFENYKNILRESLKDWFGKEDWVRINTSGNIAGKCGTMKKGKPTTRCLPRKKAQSLTKAERKATVAKKVRGSKKGKQFVKNTEKAEFKKK